MISCLIVLYMSRVMYVCVGTMHRHIGMVDTGVRKERLKEEIASEQHPIVCLVVQIVR